MAGNPEYTAQNKGVHPSWVGGRYSLVGLVIAVIIVWMHLGMHECRRLPPPYILHH